MKAWVIRHKPTGEYMPQQVKKTSGAWTQWSPGPDSFPYMPMPRLFETREAAVRSCRCWARGIWVAEVVTAGGHDEAEYTYRDTPVPAIAVEGRRLNDLELIEVDLPL